MSRNVLPAAILGSFALLTLLAAGAFLLAQPALADIEEVEIGEKLPDFEMTDYEGETHKLSDYEGKVVVLNFVSQYCPWSNGADSTMNEIADEYDDVVFLGIDSHSDTPSEQLKAHAEKAEVPYPLLKDERNAYADKVGATRTPEIYIVDEEGELVYHGAVDNRKSPEGEAEKNYVRNALEAVQAGEEVEEKEVDAWGCTIKRVS